MPTAYLLAVDQGTTSTRAVVYDAAGRAVGAASRELMQHYPRPAGWSTTPRKSGRRCAKWSRKPWPSPGSKGDS